MMQFRAASTLPVPVEELYRWHARPGAFERLVPPWERLRILESVGGIGDGARLRLELQRGPLRLRIDSVHSDHIEGKQFRDTLEPRWGARLTHLHRFEPQGDDRSTLIDELELTPPFGPLGALARGRLLAKLRRMFTFRHRRLHDDLMRHALLARRSRLDIAVSGATGLVGRQLCAFLSTGGHRVRRLVRTATAAPGDIVWDPKRGTIDAAALDGVDAVIHLAGENLAAGRWSAARKREILDSRVQSTRLLSQTIAQLERPPRVFLSASAVGFYGDRGEPVDEHSGTGTGFLAEVCRAWEQAADPAREAGLRVVHPRIGMVIAGQAGALPKLLTPLRLGVGGTIGSGQQMTSWITLDDLIGALYWMLFDESLSGAVNTVAPRAVSHRELIRTLAGLLSRPALVPLPAFVVRLAFGEMGQRVLLDGASVVPQRLLAAGFSYLHPELSTALQAEIGTLPAPQPVSW